MKSIPNYSKNCKKVATAIYIEYDVLKVAHKDAIYLG